MFILIYELEATQPEHLGENGAQRLIPTTFF